MHNIANLGVFTSNDWPQLLTNGERSLTNSKIFHPIDRSEGFKDDMIPPVDLKYEYLQLDE